MSKDILPCSLVLSTMPLTDTDYKNKIQFFLSCVSSTKMYTVFLMRNIVLALLFGLSLTSSKKPGSIIKDLGFITPESCLK